MGHLALVVLGAVLVLSTTARVHVWGAERRLWMEAVAHSPEKPRPWVNLGRMYAADGADDLAAAAYQRAAQLALETRRMRVEGPMRGRHIALLNLAILRAAQGRLSEALTLTADIQPRATNGRSIVDHLEGQWRQAQATGAPYSGF